MSIELLTNTLVAAQAALDGGAAILNVYNNEETQVEIKGDDSPLTQADLKSNAAIMEHLSKTSYWVLSEEGKHMEYADRKDISIMWIVDPLDGTKEFIKRNGEFTVNVALVQDGTPVIGVVYVPVTGELYLGIVGQGSKKYHFDAGATLSRSDLDGGTALPVAMDRPFTAVGSRSHMNQETSDFLEQYRKEHGTVEIMSKGSSLKICMVAEGLADIYPRFAPTMEWDTAAGQAVVEAAGFQMVTKDMRTPLKYNKENLLNPYFIVL